MKIVDKTKTQKTVKGQTIKPGECFLFNGELYIAAVANDAAYNCENGKHLYRYGLNVIPVEATITYGVMS